MKRRLVTLICFILSLNAYSQSGMDYCPSVFNNETFYKFEGIRYLPEVTVDSQKECIIYVLRDNTNKIIVNKRISFNNLPLERYISFYNSIGLLSDGNSNYYFYDFISNKKMHFKGQYNKYNEGIKLGKYNPILLEESNTLLIINEKLTQIRSIKLKVSPGKKQYWILMGGEEMGTNVLNGKICLLKLIKEGMVNAENKYEKYIYDVLTDKMNLIK